MPAVSLDKKVLIFRTSVSTAEELDQVSITLSPERLILRWSLDLEDCDKILKIETIGLSIDHIIQLLDEAGIPCEELPE